MKKAGQAGRSGHASKGSFAAIGARVRESWQKNSPELLGVFNGALPGFVLSPRPMELGDGVPVFCYHQVRGEDFGRDLEFLRKNGYGTLSAAGLLAHIAGGRRAPLRSVVLSFDDGAENFHRTALPLLRRFGCRALLFIAPALHEPAADEPLPTPSPAPMTWAQLAEVRESDLVDLAAHTLAHRYIPRWPEASPLIGCAESLAARRRGAPLPLEEDLLLAREMIARRLALSAVVHLAFPQYDGTPAAVEAARRVGYKACYWGLLPGRPLNRPGQDPMYISRLSGEFLRRLPGEGRIGLAGLFSRRCLHVLQAQRRRL